MSVTASQLLVGVDDFKIDGTSVGSTQGGVVLTKEYEYLDKMVDQSLDAQGAAKISEVTRVSTNVAEATLTNLKNILDIPSDIENNASDNTLSYGTTSTVTYHTLTFEGTAPSQKVRTYYFYRAVVTEVGDIEHLKDGMTLIPVTFTIYADTSKPATKQLGYFEDTTS